MKMNKVLLSVIGGTMLTFMSCSNTDTPLEPEANDPDVTPVESSAEFTVTIENVVTPKPIFQSGVFAIPVGAAEPAPLFPGDAYEFEIDAGPNVLPGDGGTRLSFVTMFVQSNDLFLAPDEQGIALYSEDGTPMGSDGPVNVTDQVLLWDAGTEVNEPTGGPNQKPQQAPDAEDQGEDENGVVTEIVNNSCSFGNELPSVDQVVKVTLEYIGAARFKVYMKNVSNTMTIAVPAQGEGATAPVPVSPGVYAVHTMPAPFFVEGEPASGAGLVGSSEGVENIAEDGFLDALAADTQAATGLIVPLSPGAWAVHEQGIEPIYTIDTPDFGEGLEGIAEDGAAAMLAASLSGKQGVTSSGVFNTAIGASEPGAIGPGGSYQFTFEGTTGDYLSLATMFVQSNDWFYSFAPEGIALFEEGVARGGDLTQYVFLYDAGTEADEYAGAGLSQVIRQGELNAGEPDSDDNVRFINPDDFSNIPASAEVIKVSISSTPN